MTRRAVIWSWTALALFAVMLLVAVAVPIPYLVRGPGPVFDVLGEVDGQPVLRIDGARQYPTQGSLYMTTVAQSGGSSGVVTVGSAIAALLKPDMSVNPDPDAGDHADDSAIQRAMFDASGTHALGAAAAYLDRPVRTRPVVVRVAAGTPADGRLQAGDLIDAVDGHPVATVDEVGSAIRGRPAGTEFTFRLTRGDDQVSETVTSTVEPGTDHPSIGVNLDLHYSSNFTATVTLSGVGGSSAGLMFAVGIVDLLTADDLVAGETVAGTGTIDGAGQVGVIGGIDKKMLAARDAGASVFIAPLGNCDDAAGAVPDGLRLVPVSTLAETVDVLRASHDGQALPSCPASASATSSG